MNKPQQFVLPPVPSFMFRNKRGTKSVFEDRKAQGKKYQKIIEKVVTPKEGGIYTYHKSFKYPEKGFRRDEVVMANQFAKRVFITWIRFLSFKYLIPSYVVVLIMPWKIKILEKWLREQVSASEIFLESYYLEDIYYSNPCRAILKGLDVFLKHIGISEEISRRFALSIAHFIEFDTAYRYLLEDTMSETTLERMLKDPIGEIMRLVKLIAERGASQHVVDKSEGMVRLLTFALWIPRVRKGFKKALESVNFAHLQLDEADHYHVRHFTNYNFFGMTIEERIKKWKPEEHMYMTIDLKQFK